MSLLADISMPEPNDDPDEGRIESWAQAIFQAQRERVQIPAPSREFGDLSLEQAYRVQARVTALRVEAGERQIGWKVGATSFAILEQFKDVIDGPSYGALLSATTLRDPESVCAGDFFSMGLEAEIGVVLDKPLRGPGITPVEVLRAARGVLATAEILDGRIEPGTGGLSDGTADNAYHGAAILGPLLRPAQDFDFVHEGVVVRKNGRLFGSACGVEALGNPLSVVSWLANELARHGGQIEAGHVVLTGSLAKVLPAQAGDLIEMSFSNLGAIRFDIEA